MRTIELELPSLQQRCTIVCSPISFDVIRPLASQFVIITDTKIEGLWGKKLLKAMQDHGLKTVLCTFPEGEENKTRQTKSKLEDQMQEHKLGRETAVVALGGGVVTDLAGFIAATYCRGVPLISIPTTLMGMVDASIGGKNGVNTPFGKNLIGTYYQPACIFIDEGYLSTLSDIQMQNGMAEVIKYALIARPSLFEKLQSKFSLSEIIGESISVKCAVVAEDFLESGFRRILNFGHTVGHALEQAEKYTKPHGHAIAIGMLVESFISKELGYLSQKDFEKICALITHFRFPLRTQISVEALLKGMALDKKGKQRFVLLQKIGEVVPFEGEYCCPVEEGVIEKAWHWLQKTYG